MAVGAILQLRCELRVINNRQSAKPFKVSSSKLARSHQLQGISLSSYSLGQDVWGFSVSDGIHRRKYHTSIRCNWHICRAAISTSAKDILLLKLTTLNLARSCNSILKSPIVLRLAPAVGIMIFAIWGLGSLLRFGRKLFHNDSNWKRSQTYLFFTSYLQPILLWTGAVLICGALDPIVLTSEASQVIKQRLLSFVKSLSTVLATAYCLSNLIQQMQKFFVEKSCSDDARNMGFQFAGKAVYTAVWIAAFSLFIELLGFSTKRWLTAGGLGTVLLTLAGREIFTNFLSSIMIHATRPFVANEWIQTKIEGYEVSGIVEHVGWWSPTIIRGENREAVHIPNHQFTVNVVRNLSQKTHWRIKTHLAISHLDANKIGNIVADMRKVLAKNPQIEQQRLHRRVFLDNINPENQALLILVSCFVKTSYFEEYLCVKEGIFLDLLRVISHHRARLATPIRTVQKIYGDAGVENIPFADTIFSRAESANRPLLLIEPPLRINGDEKTKFRSLGRSSDDQSPKSPTTSETNPASTSHESFTEKHHKQKKFTSAGDGAKFDSSKPSPTALSSSPHIHSSNEKPTVLPEPPINQADNPAAPARKIEGDWHSRPSFEDNIVLGVALDGSKRTLPIEEVIDQSPAMNLEGKEIGAACGMNCAATLAVKDQPFNKDR